MRLSKIMALVLTGCMAVNMLTACASPGGSSSGNTEAASSGGATGAAAPADAGLHNLSDGVLDVGTTISWDSMTPFRSNTANNAPYAYLAYETLAKLSEDKEYVPLVAKSWSREDDGVTFQIEIYDLSLIHI